jgi:hypothetical protein
MSQLAHFCCQLVTFLRTKASFERLPNSSPTKLMDAAETVQKAMAVAFAYPEPEKGGRGKKTNYPETGHFSKQRLSIARQVLHHSRDLARAVLRDAVLLSAQHRHLTFRLPG